MGEFKVEMSPAKIIAVGSVKHGQGITSICFNLGYKLSTLINKKILIIDTNFMFKEMGFVTDQTSANTIDELISMVKTQEVSKEIFMLHTEEVNKNLRIINSSNIDSLDYIKKNSEYLIKVMDEAKKYFDLIIVDATAGVKSPLTRMIFNKCDLFINVLTQNPYVLNWYLKNSDFKGDKELNVVNLYEEDVYPAMAEIKKDFGIKEILPIRYSRLFRHFYNQKILDPFYRTTEDVYNVDFSQLISKIGERLEINELKKINIVNTNMLVSMDDTAISKKKGMFSGLFNMFKK